MFIFDFALYLTVVVRIQYRNNCRYTPLPYYMYAYARSKCIIYVCAVNIKATKKNVLTVYDKPQRTKSEQITDIFKNNFQEILNNFSNIW